MGHFQSTWGVGLGITRGDVINVCHSWSVVILVTTKVLSLPSMIKPKTKAQFLLECEICSRYEGQSGAGSLDLENLQFWVKVIKQDFWKLEKNLLVQENFFFLFFFLIFVVLGAFYFFPSKISVEHIPYTFIKLSPRYFVFTVNTPSIEKELFQIDCFNYV